MSIVTTFENQCRALCSSASPDENVSRFLVGTLNPDVKKNLLYLFEYKDDNNSLAKVSLGFPFGEIWHLSASDKSPNLFAGVLGNRTQLSIQIFKLPDDLSNPIEDDYGFSESSIDKIYEPIPKGENLVLQTHWQPDDGCQLLTCDNGILDFWDINHQKRARSFSLITAAEKSLDLEANSLRPKLITELRWSSLFNCSVVAATIGSKIYGIDTRISDSSPASTCWLVEDQRCNRVRTIDFNPNSQYYIASGGDDCRANFWDLRQTSAPVLHIQTHTHWIWSIRYNPFHDQLVLSAGSDARVALMRAQSIASEPYGQVIDEDEDAYESKNDKTKVPKVNVHDDDTDRRSADKDDDGVDDSNSRVDSETTETKILSDEVIQIYDEHDDSVYAVEWASDPWIFASLGFESRMVINKVPKTEKFNILF